MRNNLLANVVLLLGFLYFNCVKGAPPVFRDVSTQERTGDHLAVDGVSDAAGRTDDAVADTVASQEPADSTFQLWDVDTEDTGDFPCGCPDCDDGFDCTVDTCVGCECKAELLPGFCLIAGGCFHVGEVAASNSCGVCSPDELVDAWTALPDGTPCGQGAVCHEGWCCPAATYCAGRECGPDGCGGWCGDCAADHICQDDVGLCRADCQLLCAGKACGSVGVDEECHCGLCDDGDPCTAESCTDEGQCQFMLGVLVCDDLNSCTDDECVTGVGCVFTPDDANQCSDGDICNGLESCLAGACQPGQLLQCVDMPCTDDFCMPASGCFHEPLPDGTACGGGGQWQCSSGQCACVPDCDGKECGPDGCGGSCGGCSAGPCYTAWCEEFMCSLEVSPFFCLIDGECAPSGTKDPGDTCQACRPQLAQTEWSPEVDGTACGVGKHCYGGTCCDPKSSCAGKECGDDGCGGSCGKCGCGEVCETHACVFHNCDGKECGDDGCGGMCGVCCEGGICIQDACGWPSNECDDGNCVDWDGCTKGAISEFGINEDTSRVETSPVVATLAGGDFLVAWSVQHKGFVTCDIVARELSAAGAFVGGDQMLSTPANGTCHSLPSVTGLPDSGSFAAAWVVPPQKEVRLTVCTGPGVLGCTTDTPINTPDGGAAAPDVAASSATIITAWDRGWGLGTVRSACWRPFGCDGNSIGAELCSSKGMTGALPRVRALDDGTFLLIWRTSESTCSSDYGICSLRLDQLGVPLSPEVALAGPRLHYDFAVVAGSTVVLVGRGEALDARMYIYDLELNLQSEGTVLGIPPAPAVVKLRLTPLYGGGLALVFGAPSKGPDDITSDIFVSRFDIDFAPMGGIGQANVFDTFEQHSPAAASNAEGTLLVVWTSLNQDGYENGIFGQRYAADGTRLYH